MLFPKLRLVVVDQLNQTLTLNQAIRKIHSKEYLDENREYELHWFFLKYHVQSDQAHKYVEHVAPQPNSQLQVIDQTLCLDES